MTAELELLREIAKRAEGRGNISDVQGKVCPVCGGESGYGGNVLHGRDCPYQKLAALTPTPPSIAPQVVGYVTFTPTSIAERYFERLVAEVRRVAETCPNEEPCSNCVRRTGLLAEIDAERAKEKRDGR